MKNRFTLSCSNFVLSALAVAVSHTAHAQDMEVGIEKPVIRLEKVQNPIEEVLIIGRLQSSAADVIMERMQSAVVVDVIGAEQISRIGDSNVAAALSRVPGVTLVDDQFVYVRGLGERYISTQLNNAVVPSPDLTRNVIPLNIFPTSIVESLSVQKTASADQTAAFGGGIVDIRTKGLPDDRVFNIELGTFYNTESSGEFLTYNGGADNFGQDDGTRALSPTLQQGIQTYRGDITLGNIRDIANTTTEGAKAINRELALGLNRDVSVVGENVNPNINGQIAFGDIYALPKGMEAGFIAALSYSDEWVKSDTARRIFTNPSEELSFEERSTHTINLNASLSAGLRLNEVNSVEFTHIFLRNSQDDTRVVDLFNNNRPVSSLTGFRNYDLRFEQRELTVSQIKGQHELDSLTLSDLGLEALSFLEGVKIDWYVSDSDVVNDIPNQLNVQANTISDENGNVLSSTIDANLALADYRFTELNDNVDSSGIKVTYPVYTNSWVINLEGGADNWLKTRTYEQLQFSLGSSAFTDSSPLLDGNIGDVLSDENISNPDNGFETTISNSNSESYIAVNKVDAAFGKIDATLDETWRIAAGLRYESYQQVNLLWNPIGFEGSRIIPFVSQDPARVAEYFDDAVFTEDDVFGSLALTYMTQGFGADDFNLRLGFSQTTVRPDLREISSASYIDPITGVLVFGNPDVVPSKLDNVDLRAEWFDSTGDTVSVTVFGSRIDNPIELFEAPGGDGRLGAEIHNADSGSTLGLEIEFLRNLGFISMALEPFFLQGNFTLLDHELEAGDSADAPTNSVRGFAGASDFSGNLILGFDSDDGRHTTTVAYNYFSERLFSAGRLGSPDVFEQPFNSLNLTYAFFPTDEIIVKFKAKNILDQNLILEQGGVEIFEERQGQTFSLSVQYNY